MGGGAREVEGEGLEECGESRDCEFGEVDGAWRGRGGGEGDGGGEDESEDG